MSGRLKGGVGAEWRQHLTIVLASMAGVAMSTINSYSVGVFIEPLQLEQGWTRAQITAGPALTAPAIILMASVMGVAVDRFGPRKISMIGVSALFILNLLMSQVGPQLWNWYATWSLMEIANLAIQPSVWTAAVSGMFQLVGDLLWRLPFAAVAWDP